MSRFSQVQTIYLINLVTLNLSNLSLVLGEIVCDPLCGGGSISIETAINWSDSFNLCGDNFQTAPARTQDNVTYVNSQRAAENK